MNAPANDQWHPIADAMDDLIRLEMERHAWLFRDAGQVREWREEDGNWDDD